MCWCCLSHFGSEIVLMFWLSCCTLFDSYCCVIFCWDAFKSCCRAFGSCCLVIFCQFFLSYCRPFGSCCLILFLLMLLILLHTIWMLLSHCHLLVLLSDSHLKVGCAVVYTRPSPEANLAANCSGKVADRCLSTMSICSVGSSQICSMLVWL